MTKRNRDPVLCQKPDLPDEAREHVEALARVMGVEPDVVDEDLRRLQARLVAQRENADKARGGGRPRRKEVDLAMRDLGASETAALFFFDPHDDTGQPIPADHPRRREIDAEKAAARKAAVAGHVAENAREKNGETSRRTVSRLVAENVRRRGLGSIDLRPQPDDFDFDPHLDKLGPLDPPKN